MSDFFVHENMKIKRIYIYHTHIQVRVVDIYAIYLILYGLELGPKFII